jgi:hypothetical protein
MVNPAAPARKDRPARPETPAVTDHEAIPALPLSALQVPQETPAQLAPTDHPDQPVNPDPKETTVLPAPPDPKARPAQLAAPARMARLATKAHPAQTDPRESPVFAPSTALWTVASSSRTEHGDKPAVLQIPSSFQSWSSKRTMDTANVHLYSRSISIFLLLPHFFPFLQKQRLQEKRPHQKHMAILFSFFLQFKKLQ